MTMAFAIEGPAQVQGLKPGDEVTFTFVQEGTGPRIVSIQRSGQ
jgi:Cu(I)/Ag(I) efflux system membrane fusion protein